MTRGRSNAHWLSEALKNAERSTPERNRWYRMRDWDARFASESDVIRALAHYGRRFGKLASQAEISELVARAREARRRFRREVAKYGASTELTTSYLCMVLAREYTGTRRGPGALPPMP